MDQIGLRILEDVGMECTWRPHGGDGEGLKKCGKFIQQVKRMAAVVRELQRAFQCLRAASDIEMALF